MNSQPISAARGGQRMAPALFASRRGAALPLRAGHHVPSDPAMLSPVRCGEPWAAGARQWAVTNTRAVWGRMIEEMATVRITEAELARDVRAVLAKIEQGSEVIIEREDHRAVAVIRAPHRSGRPITEILDEAKRRNSTVTPDEDFGRDLEKIIDSHQQPWHPPSWN